MPVNFEHCVIDEDGSRYCVNEKGEMIRVTIEYVSPKDVPADLIAQLFRKAIATNDRRKED